MLDSDKCKKFGIVDFIGMPHIKPITMFQIEVAPEKVYAQTKAETKQKATNNRFDKKPKRRKK